MEQHYWKGNEVEPELAAALGALGEFYPLAEGEGQPRLLFSVGRAEGECRVARAGGEIRIAHGTVSDALRGLGAVLAGRPAEGETISETRPFSTLGIMLDCSRNAVMKVEHVKSWLRQLALLGYNMVMLYTEDTYRIPGEPFFGLFRGAYTEAELKEMDDYAAGLGIELIGCIQTLGHLEQMLKWGVYGKVRDTDRELLVGEPATYELIRKMIVQMSKCLRSRRLHVGMDETWTLGRGRFLDLNGQKSGYEMLTKHLAEVTRICREEGVRPMIWSDMFFKFGGNMHTDYDLESAIPDEVKAAIPPELELVYWDYNSDTVERYAQLIGRHRELGRDPIVASGVWTWLRLWYGRRETEAAALPCIQACKQANLPELFFTMWGDGGSCCEFDSALAGLAAMAAEVYDEKPESMKARYRAICGLDYDQTLLGCELEFPPQGAHNAWSAERAAASVIWDDPFFGMHWLGVKARYPGYWSKAAEHYRELAQKLAAHRHLTEPVDLGHAAVLAELLAARIAFRLELEEAYPARDASRLTALAKQTENLVSLVEQAERTFRRQWLKRNKPNGLETIQIRLGGLRQRFIEMGRALSELAEGERESIPELDEGLALSQEAAKALHPGTSYPRLATPGVF